MFNSYRNQSIDSHCKSINPLTGFRVSGILARNVLRSSPANIYLFKVNDRNTRKRCEISSKLTIEIPDDVVLLLSLLTLNIFHALVLVFLSLTFNK